MDNSNKPKTIPGPWSITHGDDLEHTIAVPGTDDAIADVYASEANARMISASPEMYEALAALDRAIMDWRTRGEPDLNEILDAQEKAVFALAKATMPKVTGE